jgi:hypothetical protein
MGEVVREGTYIAYVGGKDVVVQVVTVVTRLM